MRTRELFKQLRKELTALGFSENLNWTDETCQIAFYRRNEFGDLYVQCEREYKKHVWTIDVTWGDQRSNMERDYSKEFNTSWVDAVDVLAEILQ